MKTVNIAELKTHLSRYLRAVRRGERIVVLDRREPVAELRPLEGDEASPWEGLAREDRVTLGTQDWRDLKFSRTRERVPIQDLLHEVREDKP
jgi:antitoxin (DNA-binding transcriptional repressor) of toxin-antitoxin stability system